MSSKCKRLLSMVLVVVMVFSMLPGLTAYAADDTMCSSTQPPADYHTGEGNGFSEEAPVLNSANSGKDVLLIQTNLPWDSYANTDTLTSLAAKGFHDGYTVVSMAEAVNVRFSDYSLVIYANDQTTETYNQYDLVRVSLEQYIYNGGVVLFGACDAGWAAGVLSEDLPGGVTKYDDVSMENYIADFNHPIVTAELTGGTPLTDAMLYSNACSHISFNPESLPAGHRVILRSSNTGDPTLVEYPYGNGRVIASGLTWEFDYDYTQNGYSQNSIDDYFAYGLHVAGVKYEAPEDVNAILFDYNQDTRYEDLAEKCVTYSLLAYRETDEVKQKGRPAYYVAGDDATLLGKLLHNDGYKDLESYYYPQKAGDYITANKYNDASENTSLYTIGHRKVKDGSGNVYDQLVVVFRGTYDQEWYGNFDLTGYYYDSNYDYSWSFQNAVDLAMEDLSTYIGKRRQEGKINPYNLKILLTGHSRGAAVANMMAHELTDIRNGIVGRNGDLFSDMGIVDVYAYTFATPNVASYDYITGFGTYKNIFNFCFTDDFVPNLPLESWGWGKYGQTYWATAAKLKNNKTFYNAAVRFFGEKPSYKTTYTENIAYTMSDATKPTRFRYSDPIRNYYDYGFMFGIGQSITLHSFIRSYLGGSMQVSDKDAASTAKVALVTTALNGITVASCLKDLSWNLVKGSSLDDVLDIHTNGGIHTGIRADFKMNGPLNYAHQCGSYYTAVKNMYSSFVYNKLTEKGYAATLYSDGSNTETVGTAEDQVAALKAFLEIVSVDQESGVESSNADILGWDINDVTTWEGVTWENDSVVALDMHYAAVTGALDLSAFPDLAVLNVRYCNLTELTGIGSTSLTKLDCSGNALTSLDLTGASKLAELNCTNNALGVLDLTDCVNLEALECMDCRLTELVLNSSVLTSLACANNYLDTEDAELCALVEATNASEDGYADFLPQNIPADAEYDADDLAALLSIANTDANLDILGWDLENPASWAGITWILDGGEYHLETVSLAGLELTGEADFSACEHLTYLILSGNSFTALNTDNCTGLESFWVEYNYLSEHALSLFVEETGIENYKIGNQRSLKPLNEEDVALLNALAEAQELDWDPALYANNTALTWIESADGIWVLSAMDLTGTGVSGVLDLSGFRHLTDVICVDTNISELILPEIDSIQDFAFANNPLLKSVTVPASVTTIGADAFRDCSRLALVDFLGKAPALGTDCFAGCKENLTLSLHFQFDTCDLFVGDTLKLDTTAFPKDSALSWSSSKESVAAVDENGVVTALEYGTALISAVSEDGFSATCTILVPDHIHEFYYTDNGDGTHTKACYSCERVVTEDHTFAGGFCTGCGIQNDSYVPGDINGDNDVNNKDLTRLFQYLSNWDVNVVEAALDVNGDGDINNKDLTRLFQYLSNWDVQIY